MTDDECGYETAKGTECELPASREDGRCHHHTDVGDSDSGGRPSKFTDERARAAITAAELGKSERGCGRDAGVSRETIRAWRERDDLVYEDTAGETHDFADAFRRARGNGETHYIVEGGNSDGDVDPSFAKFMLASSYDYVKTEKREQEHTTADGFEFVINASDED